MIITYLRLITIIATLLLVVACETVTVPEPTVVEQAPAKEVKPAVRISPSASPIANPTKTDILFAQKALKALGYPIGGVDGIWGKRSSTAMMAFERKQNIPSANGKLSALNLVMLKSTNARTSAPVLQVTQRVSGITSKLSTPKPNPKAPELIIVDQNYAILLKPNPFSEVVTNIEPGAAIYVLSLQSGWYEVETLSDLRGFIKAE